LAIAILLVVSGYRFGFIVRTDSETESYTDRQNTEVGQPYTHAITIGVRKIAGASVFEGFVAQISRKEFQARQRLEA